MTVAPLANASGSPTITVTVSDGSATASDSFVLTVTPVNDAPVATADTSSALENVSLTIPWGTLFLNDTDVDTLSTNWIVSSVGDAENGSVGNVTATKNVTFTPTPDFWGDASFTYTLWDGALGSTATVTVTVTETGTVDTDDTGDTGDTDDTDDTDDDTDTDDTDTDDTDTDSDDDTDLETDDETDLAPDDADGDTYTVAEGDCNDSDSTVNPGADEVLDDVDQNCDGYVDPKGKVTLHGCATGTAAPILPLALLAAWLGATWARRRIT